MGFCRPLWHDMLPSWPETDLTFLWYVYIGIYRALCAVLVVCALHD